MQPVDETLKRDSRVIDKLFELNGVDRFYIGDEVDCYFSLYGDPTGPACKTEVLDIFVDPDTGSLVSVLCSLPGVRDRRGDPTEYDLGWFRKPVESCFK